jgi:hypothetical protein
MLLEIIVVVVEIVDTLGVVAKLTTSRGRQCGANDKLYTV